jgi:hypothetical protein
MVSLIDLLALRFYMQGTTPVFLFSLLDYGGQTVATLYLERSQGLLERIGRTSLLVVASESAYELVFKLNFVVYEKAYLNYLMRNLFPAAVLLMGTVAALAIRRSMNFRYARTIFLSTAVLWFLWNATGTFPAPIRLYEANPASFPLTLIFNAATKTCMCASFAVTVYKQRPRARTNRRTPVPGLG